MKTAKTMMRTALAAMFLFSGITTSAYGFIGGGGSWVGIDRPAVMRIKGKVFCTDCDVNEVRKAQPRTLRLYQLTYQQGRAVMQVEWVSNPGRWNRVVWPARVWLRGTDALLAKLAAQENLQKEVEITGILSNSRTFDIAEVVING